jgi:predicted Ser/Thr protein kinase
MPFPTHLGKYEIRRELGKGSMGVVYEAFDPLIERSVAIKIIRPDQLGPSQSVELLARLKREAQAVGRLNHPGVVAIYDYGEDASFGGTKVAFIAMELIDGKELKHYFDNKHRFSPSDIARIMGEVLSALQHAHERGVTHRDVKPSNVILLRSGAVKMADFGVARLEKSELTQAGTMIGTPMYMSPEQILGMAGVDGRADIFSCGVMLYQFLTGEKPFTGSVTIVMQKVLNEEPPPPTQLNPSLSPAWDAVVRKAMAKKPADRYQSAAALADAIRGAAATKGDESTVVLPIQRAPASSATLNAPASALGNVPAPAPVPPSAAAASGTPAFTAPPASAADADGTAWTGAVPPGRNVAEDPTMFVRAKAPSERAAHPPAASAPATLPSDPLAMPSAPGGSSAGGSGSTSAIFGAGFGATPGQGAGTATMRSASQAAAAAAVSAVLSSHRQPAQAAPGAHPGDDPDATALRPGGPPAPPPRTPAAAASAPAAGVPSAATPSAAKPLLIGGGVIILLLLAAGAFWLTRSPSAPVATLPDPAASAVVTAPAPAPEPIPAPVEPPAPPPEAAASAPELAPAPPVVVAAPAEPPSAPAAAESPNAADWRERTARLQAARNPLGLPAALGLLLDLPSADDRRVAADLDTLMKSRPPHSALALAVSDGQLRFHWQSGRPSANGAADAAVRRCRELFGSKAGCAAVVVNGDFKRDAFTSVAGLLGSHNAATVRSRFLRTLDRAIAEQRAKDAPAPAEPVAATPAGRDTGTAPATPPRPVPARPVNEWADAVAQLRSAEGGLTLARGFELLLQVKDVGEVERLQQLQSAVKRLRWKSAMAIGDRGGLIGYGFAREERIVQWAEERAVAECAASGARGCTVVMVDGNLRPAAFIEFAGRLGSRGQAQVRETFLRDVQRSLQSGI